MEITGVSCVRYPGPNSGQFPLIDGQIITGRIRKRLVENEGCLNKLLKVLSKYMSIEDHTIRSCYSVIE